MSTLRRRKPDVPVRMSLAARLPPHRSPAAYTTRPTPSRCARHYYRKTVATWMDEAGLSARSAADQLGYAKPSLAADIYMGRRKRAAGAAEVLKALGQSWLAGPRSLLRGPLGTGFLRRAN